MKILRWGQTSIVKFLFLVTVVQTYGQDTIEPFKDTIGLPNFSVISTGYEIFASVFKTTGDSILAYDKEFLDYLAASGNDTTGLTNKKIEEWDFQDSLVEHVDYFQNIFFDFKNGTVTYIAEDKNNLDTIIQVFPDPINTEACAYVVWISTNGGYNICHVNYDESALSYEYYFPDLETSGTFRAINSQFIQY
jgi:hypothetical protein